MQKQHKIITAALPYANGPLHLGHLVGYIQADIWTRYWRLRQTPCHFICGSDAHGTPIMLHAQKKGIPPETLVSQIQAEHHQHFQAFGVEFDAFGTTHSAQNQALVCSIFNILDQQGYIERRCIQQWYDSVKGLFLPDRYVKGICPHCHRADQYGDHCEGCGMTYDATQLLSPVSALSQTTPILRETEHCFFKLSQCQTWLSEWLSTTALQSEVRHKLHEWLETGLLDWDVTRDAPYFGFEVPNQPGQYFYVWLDAPLGYLSIYADWSQQQQIGQGLQDWAADSQSEIYHFIGKDIIYFHGLFWPALLQLTGYKPPTNLFANGFLTINGQKMSKSRGSLVTAAAYLNCAPPEYLRYYLASKSNTGVADLDLDWSDFVQKVNSDLVGKLVNFASRCAKLLEKSSHGALQSVQSHELLLKMSHQASDIAAYYQKREFSKVTRQVMQWLDEANQFFSVQAPWSLAPDKACEICSIGLNIFRVCLIFLTPIVPQLAAQAADWLQDKSWSWDDLHQPLEARQLAPYQALARRIQLSDLNTLSQGAAHD